MKGALQARMLFLVGIKLPRLHNSFIKADLSQTIRLRAVLEFAS